jgi:hypothetical protein
LVTIVTLHRFKVSKSDVRAPPRRTYAFTVSKSA